MEDIQIPDCYIIEIKFKLKKKSLKAPIRSNG